MQKIRDKAIVLCASTLKETDVLAKLFTLEHGVLTAAANSGRKSVKRFGGGLNLFTLIECSLTLKENRLSTIDETVVISLRPLIEKRTENFALASYCCELTERLMPERMQNIRVFRLLSYLLEAAGIDENINPSSARRFFEINILNILGYMPILDRISESARKRLEASLATSRISSVIYSQSELEEAGRFLDSCIYSHIDRPLRSVEFFNEIIQEGR